MGNWSSIESDSSSHLVRDTETEPKLVPTKVDSKLNALPYIEDPPKPPIVSLRDACDSENEHPDRKEAAICAIIASLKLRGYALVSTDDDNLSGKLSSLFASRDRFFAHDMETKRRYSPSNLGVPSNLGYVHVTKVREYLKLRPCDGDEMFPTDPEALAPLFLEVLDILRALTWDVFIRLAEESNEAGERLIATEHVDAVREFVPSKSSLSMIHYFEQEPVEDALRKDACALHCDTGILTCGVTSDVPGLEMYDKHLGGWVNVEKWTSPNDICLFIGEKVPLYSRSLLFEATPHRVIIPPDTERCSTVFLLDVAK